MSEKAYETFERRDFDTGISISRCDQKLRRAPFYWEYQTAVRARALKVVRTRSSQGYALD